jgi:hypothetical protein
MKKISPFVLFILFFTIFLSAVFAEEKYISDLKIWIVTKTEGPNNSDYLFLNVKLYDEGRKLISEFPKLVGPIKISSVNRQIFSCESNAIIGTEKALVFDLRGKLVFSFEHLGFLRKSGMTKDQKLYWLLYNIVTESGPTNILVVLDHEGKVVLRNQFKESRIIRFNYKEHRYALDIPRAELPG